VVCSASCHCLLHDVGVRCIYACVENSLTEILEGLLDLLVRESQSGLLGQQRGVQPVVLVVAKHRVGTQSVVGLAFGQQAHNLQLWQV